MRSVRLFDYLQHDGQSWQVVSQDGTMLALKNLTTGRIRKLAVGDLLGDDSYLPDPPKRLPNLDNVAVLDTLDPETRQRTEFWHRHVVEVLTGVPPSAGEDETEPRPKYHPDNLLGDRIQAKAAELTASGTPVSERSLRRYVAAYRKDGIGALVDGL